MRQDVYGEVAAALRSARTAGLLSGPYFGFRPPKLITGCYYPPAGFSQSNTGLATTATRCYYVPFPIFEAHTFTAASIFNTLTSDTGKKFRIMIFNDDAASGGPGTLAKDFGEITLDNTAAVRTLTSSWSAAPGMYWAAVWGDSSATIASMIPWSAATAVGFSIGYAVDHAIGTFSATGFNSSSIYGVSVYVDTTYGAAPASAVAPNNTLNMVAGVGTGVTPSLRLKA